MDVLIVGFEKEVVFNKYCKELMDNLVVIDGIFLEKLFFMSDDFMLVDCCVVFILWCLFFMGIEL